jgi:peroxiredoxin
MKPFRSALVALAAVAALAGSAAAQDQVQIGQDAKRFPATDTFNMRPTKDPLKSLAGRVVLFMMFETWYQQCADGVPDFNALNDKYGPRGFTVLACGAQEKKVAEPFIAEKGVKFAWALIDTPTQEQFKRDWPFPAMPHAFLIDAHGKVVWQGHPRMVPAGTIEPHLAAATQAPLLPASLAPQQKLLDDGLWAAAKTSLEAVAAEGELDKTDLAWAKGTATWIEQRRAAYATDADALCKKGWWWDAWDLMNDFPRRFEGMPGADVAKAKADEIRKTPEAAKDLAQGDDVAKAKDLAAKKNVQGARLILTRIAKEAKGTRHAERAREALEKLPAK